MFLDLIFGAVFARTPLAATKEAALQQLADGKPMFFTGKLPDGSTPAPGPSFPGKPPGPGPTPQRALTTIPGGGATTMTPLAKGLVKRTDLVAAREMAPMLAQELANKGKSYARPLLEQFQWFTGLTDKDGLYGPRSAGALAWALNQETSKVPASMFPIGAVAAPYTPAAAA